MSIPLPSQPVAVVPVDFNDVDGDEVATATTNLTSGMTLRVGETVVLREGRSITCWAVVTSVTEHLVTFHVDWDTWREASTSIVASVELAQSTSFAAFSPNLQFVPA